MQMRPADKRKRRQYLKDDNGQPSIDQVNNDEDLVHQEHGFPVVSTLNEASSLVQGNMFGGFGRAPSLATPQQQILEQALPEILSTQMLQQQSQQTNAYLTPSSNNIQSQQLAILRDTLTARAQLQAAHAQLFLRSKLPPGSYGSTQEPSLLASIGARDLTQRDPTVTDISVSANQDRKMPYFDAIRLPEPASDEEEENDDDEMRDSTSEPNGDNTATTAPQEKFPAKLYRMLEEAEHNGDDSIVSFFPHGRAFIVHKPREFVVELMPKYFTTTRMSSFQRQLNLYGFRRINDGRDKGGYFHEYFLRGRKSLCKKIHRAKKAPQTPPATTGGEALRATLSNQLEASSIGALNTAILDQLNRQVGLELRQQLAAAVNPAILAQLNQNQHRQQRLHDLAGSTFQVPPTLSTGLTIPTLHHALLGLGHSFGGPQPSGIGTSTNHGRVPALTPQQVLEIIRLLRSDLLSQSQHQHFS